MYTPDLYSSEVFPEFPTDPASLAAPLAEGMAIRSGFEHSPLDLHEIGGLEKAATTLGFMNQKYFVESRRSLAIPVDFDSDKDITYFNFMGLAFEGDFTCYSKVAIGKIIGVHTVRALCLSFEKVTLLPYFDTLPEDYLLHVPVLAVESIDKQAA